VQRDGVLRGRWFEMVLPFVFNGRRFPRGYIVIKNNGARQALTDAEFEAWQTDPDQRRFQRGWT